MPTGAPTGGAGNWWIHRTGGGGYEIVQGTAQQVDAKYGAANVRGPYPTNAAAAAAAGSVPIGSTGPPNSIESWLNSNVVGPVSNAGISLSILGPLFQANIWLRVGEVVFGIVLVAIGLNAMLKGKPLAVVTNAAGAAGKVVPGG